MSFTKNNRIICDECGLFCIPYDEETPFGCADPEAPEPLDPYHYCEKCFHKQKAYWLKTLQQSPGSGSWQKSRAEMEAAEELGLVWLHSYGIGTHGTDTNREPYRYIPKEEYERFKDLPRFVNTPNT